MNIIHPPVHPSLLCLFHHLRESKSLPSHLLLSLIFPHLQHTDAQQLTHSHSPGLGFLCQLPHLHLLYLWSLRLRLNRTDLSSLKQL